MMKMNKLRREIIKAGGYVVLAAAPLTAFSKEFMKDGKMYSDGEGVSYAAGPKPVLSTFPQKDNLVIVHTRPPHLETPFNVFNEGLITPNNRFFVRYHLADVPVAIDTDKYTITISGAVDEEVTLSLAELKSIEGQQEIVAVQQCTGNSRGYSSPRVFGAQLSNGAMGNAKFKGVPLKNVLAKAGISSAAKSVIIDGLDKPVRNTTPDFQKSLPIDHIMTGEPMLVWEMNGEPLPFLNGFPVKLIVPGWYATYWVKHVSHLKVIEDKFDNFDAFFMTTAYRLPDNDSKSELPNDRAKTTLPVNRFPIRSFVTSLENGDEVNTSTSIEIKGIAFDSGSGIKKVEVSVDGGKEWMQATLGENLGRFSFRGWKLNHNFNDKGRTLVMVRATGNSGETQPVNASWNHGGYNRNAIERTSIKVV
ncbi:molybdopterin-dependent oxidoreductase [Moritella sp.]|uniref:molybdopterin-dependent oxidoreductase n=1 Tax=Moritella sp. TaxID=78556 RepID=UPI0025CC99FD|nr:molybdopterin-dependent oxidoreductase [Moritella sp.]